MSGITGNFLYGDFILSESGTIINIKTMETKDFVRLEDDCYISDITVYKNKLYYYFIKRIDYNSNQTKMLISYDFETGRSLIEKVYFRDDVRETEQFENFLYSSPNGIYSYDSDGFVTRVADYY
jgi:hypothetical protein